MNKLSQVLFSLFLAANVAAVLSSCSPPAEVSLSPAPPGPVDLGPATGTNAPPDGAIVFDLKYRPQTGMDDDIKYFAFWGFGGSDEEAKKDRFLQEVRKRSPNAYAVQNSSFTGRKWAAIDYRGKTVSALYFDLNADGKLQDNERIPATRKTAQGYQFITPDFMQPLQQGGEILCRVLLEVNFYGNAQPNCLWSPAALLEGAAVFEGTTNRLLLFADRPGGTFDQYGSSSYSLANLDAIKSGPNGFVPRETLSSIIAKGDQFYRLSVEGRRSNGLPARVVLVKDTSPTGGLAVKLAGTNSLHTSLTSLYLRGVNDKTVFFNVRGGKDKLTLPVGSYSLNNAMLAYGTSSSPDWEVTFSDGPCATIAAGEVFEVLAGQPTLRIRAVDERQRYNSDAAESLSFKQGTPIYLEPKISGKNGETFSRFRHGTAALGQKPDHPPKVTITGPNGKELVSKSMEYG